MSLISIKTSGSFNKTESFLKNLERKKYLKNLERYGQLGVEALASATPVDSGLTAASWSYEIEETDGMVTIQWTNSNVVKGVPIAIILQYGHGTGTGGYVQGRDYINPAIRPIFDEIENNVWKEMTEG